MNIVPSKLTKEIGELSANTTWAGCELFPLWRELEKNMVLFERGSAFYVMIVEI